MADNMNYILVKTVVKKAIHDIKTDPKRTVRNLVDMALQFTDSRFQRQFFTTASKLLSNENSGYYALVQDTLTKVDEDRLLTVCMNLGYNGMYSAAKSIRSREAADGFNIPWTVALAATEDKAGRLHEIVTQGETLGIYTWHLFSQGNIHNCISLAAKHPHSAFICFCNTGELNTEVLDHASGSKNMIFIIPYDSDADVTGNTLRQMGFLYGLHYSYGSDDIDMIESGELLHDMEQLYPAFCILKPQKTCQSDYSDRVYKWVTDARIEQQFRTLPWEMYKDMLLVDEVISEEPCWVEFDAEGQLSTHKGKCENPDWNICRNDLPEIFRQALPRTQ